MREETIQDAVVLSVEPERIMVRIDKSNEDCGGCRACALKILCRGKNDTNHLDLPVPVDAASPHPQPGQTVQVAYRAANAAVAAFIMFLPALLGLFFGGFIANRLAGEGDGIFVLGCLAGVVLGLAVTFVVSRASTALRPDIRLLPQ